MPTISLGKVAFTWKGSYNNAVTYQKQDVVSHNGDSWVCLQDATVGQTPQDNSPRWELFAQGSLNVGQQNGDLIYFNGTSLAALPAGEPNQILSIDPVSGLPAWAASTYRSGVRVARLQNHHGGGSYRRHFAVMEDGSMRFWGNNAHYLHGTGASTAARSYPTRVAFPFGFSGINLSLPDSFYVDFAQVSAVIDNDGKLWTWGVNGTGATGNGTTTFVGVPYCASDDAANSIFGKTVVQIAQGSGDSTNATLWVRCSDGTVHAAGYGTQGQMGQGGTTASTRFVQVALFTGGTDATTAVQIMCSGTTTPFLIIRSATGQLFHLGSSAHSTNGVNTTNSTIPTAVAGLSGVVFKEIAHVALRGVFAIDVNNNLWCWGNDTVGFLGRGGVAGVYAPQSILPNVVEVVCNLSATANVHTYVRQADGTILASGYNLYGQLGQGNTTNLSSFTTVPDLPNNIIKMQAGGSGNFGFGAFLAENGQVFSVGYNGNGQLAVGDLVNRLSVTPVPIQGRVVDIANVGYTSEGGLSFLREDGTMLQSGYAGESQIPEDDDESTSTAYPIIF